MGYGFWKPYVPVAQRRKRSVAKVKQMLAGGKDFEPVELKSSTIAKTFWGKAWCSNLESYSDYENRLPRGRTYVRNGSVIDLKIEPGKVVAQVMGSDLYRVEIHIKPLPDTSWRKLVKECTGSIASLVELLQGQFSQAVMTRLCEPKTGLFPKPREIQLACSCPDWATMCKHAAAALYGVGARLDKQPELLFLLRQVDANDLLTAQAAELPTKAKQPTKAKVLEDTALADAFGIEMAMLDEPATEKPRKRQRANTAKPIAAAKTAQAPKTTRKAASPMAKAATKPKTRAQKQEPDTEGADAGSTLKPAARKKATTAKTATAKPRAKRANPEDTGTGQAS